MATIRVDYDNARAQATKLQAAGQDCVSIEQALQRAISAIPTVWSGASADACIDAINLRMKSIRKIQEETQRLSSLIRSVADELEEAERQLQAEMDALLQGSGNPSSGSGYGGGFSGEGGYGGGGGGSRGGF